jgi:hypothetical protein
MMMDSLNGNVDIGSLPTPLGLGIERKTAWSRWCKNAAERPNSDAIIHWSGGGSFSVDLFNFTSSRGAVCIGFGGARGAVRECLLILE